MSERKVLNKYYPPDFDPSKIPKLKLARNRQYTIRIMAPFNMRCSTCGEYIYKGKKFNSRKETVEDEDYLGLRIFRFYIKCPRCVAEIAFKTDPENTDYTLEDGATRNFEASKTAEEMAKRAAKEKEEEEMNNPMKVLENRTKASQQEMEMIETLEELKELNARQRKVNFDDMIEANKAEAARIYEAQLKALQDEEDEMIKMIYQKSDSQNIKRLRDSDEEDEPGPSKPKNVKTDKPTDILTETSSAPKPESKKAASWTKSIGGPSLGSSKAKLSMLVKKKAPSNVAISSTSNNKQGAAPPSVSNKDSDAKTSPGPAQAPKPAAAAPSGLGLLGAYSDSDSDSNNSS